MSVDRMIEMDVAKPFRILSAYLMTAAMTNPPNAYRNMQCTYLQNSHDCKFLFLWYESKIYLKSHHCPRQPVVPLKESIHLNSFTIVHKHSHESENKSKQTWGERSKQGCWTTYKGTSTYWNLKQKLVNNGYQTILTHKRHTKEFSPSVELVKANTSFVPRDKYRVQTD